MIVRLKHIYVPIAIKNIVKIKDVEKRNASPN